MTSQQPSGSGPHGVDQAIENLESISAVNAGDLESITSSLKMNTEFIIEHFDQIQWRRKRFWFLVISLFDAFAYNEPEYQSRMITGIISIHVLTGQYFVPHSFTG